MFVVGIDGGGTKTCVEIRTLENEAIERKTFGPFNINSTSKDDIKKTICSITEYIKSITGNIKDCVSICIGTAGISNPDASNMIKNSFTDNNYKNKLEIIGDHKIALYGALESNVGIGLISGTGSICFGMNDKGKSHRVGGWGHILDDKGSGYDIGREVLSSVVQAYDGRQKPTVLQELVFNKLNINIINELIKFVHDKNTTKKDIASFAPLLDNAVEQNDEVSIEILNKVCDRLVKMVSTVAVSLNMETINLAMLGSVLNKSDCIKELFIEKLQKTCPNVTPVTAKNDAATGASKLALKYYREGK